MSITHTVAFLSLTEETFTKIEKCLRAVGYHHVFFQNSDGELCIDMTGIALKKIKKHSLDKDKANG